LVDDRQVAAVVHQELKRGRQMKAAVAEAMARCGIRSADKVFAAHRKWKPLFEKHGSKLKLLTSPD
jgi:hypothetical protein